LADGAAEVEQLCVQHASSTLTSARFVNGLIAVIAAIALLLLIAPTFAEQASGKSTLGARFDVHAADAERYERRTRRAARIRTMPIVNAGFERGLLDWNTAGVGEVVPTVIGGNARSGYNSGRFVLRGNEERSELGLGGDGTPEPGGLDFYEGDEYWYGFSFNIQRMVYGGPGAHNLIMQFKSDGEGSPNFGLQLWDYEGDDGESGGKGLWSHSGAMGGDRFLSPVTERAWHDVAIHFKASSSGDGFYEVFLDGELIDANDDVSMIVPGHESAYIKTGLYRNGETASGTSELLVDDGKLGYTAASILPG
jgi:hypothetical protein